MTRKEAIKIIKSATVYTPEEMEALETLIPELKESEDERIRKTLINALKTPKSVGELKFVLPEPTREECITYLEKQKERGPLTKEEEYILHRIIEYLEDETCPPEWISLLQDIYCLPYEKQKEHSMSAKEVLVRAGLKPYKDGNKWCILVGDNIQEGICGFGDTIDEALYQFLMEVLGLQKERKPAEWSEEDEKMLGDIIRYLEVQKEDRDAPFFDIAISFLKSLRPSWKPSEEQMEALFTASTVGAPGYRNALKSIYEQLKALM